MNGSAAVYRQAAATPRHTRVLAFDKLPAAARDRLERALGNGAPDALLAVPSGVAPVLLRATVALGVSATVALGLLFDSGFGIASAADAIQPRWYGAYYALVLTLMGASVVAFRALRRLQRGAIFPSGRYLFALDLIEVDRGTLRVTSLDTLRSVEPRGNKIAVIFVDGHTAMFRTPRGETPTSAATEAWRAIQLGGSLTYPADETRLERIDPFFDVRLADDWSSAIPDSTAPSPIRGVALALAGVAAASAALGFAIVPGRNAMSEDMMFHLAKNAPTTELVARELLRYVDRGQRHQDEAFSILMHLAYGDRAALSRYAARPDHLGYLAADALFKLASGDAKELARFVARGAPRSDEADDRLFEMTRRENEVPGYITYLEVGKRHAEEAKALLDEARFARAILSPQVGTLCWFVKQSQGSKHEDAAWKRIRGMYEEARVHFEQSEHPSPDGLKFGRALLDALLERADPRVTLEIVTLPPTAVAAEDEKLAAKHGKAYLPGAARFTEGALLMFARDVRSVIGSALGQMFTGGTVEGTSSSVDDPEGSRPLFTVTIEPVVDGVSRWVREESGEESLYVTPLVGLRVEVTGKVRRPDLGSSAPDAWTETTLRWSRHIEDSTAGKMLTKDFRGHKRTRPELLDDVYEPFLEAAPERIAQSFHEKL